MGGKYRNDEPTNSFFVFQFQFIVFQNILIDADLLDEEEAEFNLYLIETSVSWLNEQGEVINTWLEENFA